MVELLIDAVIVGLLAAVYYSGRGAIRRERDALMARISSVSEKADRSRNALNTKIEEHKQSRMHGR